MRSVLTSSRGFVLIAVLALVVGACGTTTSPSPAAASPDDASPSAAPSSPASASPDQSQSPGASPSAPASSPSASGSASAGEGPDLGGAAEGLEDLTSYQLDMEVAGVVPPALASGGAGSVQMQALVDSESEAVQSR